MNLITSRQYEEKRNFIRMRVDTPVKMQSDATDDALTGVCKNLSGGGLLVEAKATLPVGAIVEVCLSSQHGHSPMLNARARIIRVDAEPGLQNTTCKLGMEIMEMLH